MTLDRIIELSNELNDILLNGDVVIHDLDGFMTEELERVRSIIDEVLEDRND